MRLVRLGIWPVQIIRCVNIEQDFIRVYLERRKPISVELRRSEDR